jgi:hypothetical protein
MVAAANGNSNHIRNQQQQQQQQQQQLQLQQQQQRKFEKEERNFQCRWCDYRGRWRSELIQHMRCHHARDKPYHCSACPYASSWKWDVQVRKEVFIYRIISLLDMGESSYSSIEIRS